MPEFDVLIPRVQIMALLLALVAGAVSNLSPTAAAAAEQTSVRSQHGDWQVVCKKPPGAKTDVCAVVQDVTSESNPNVGLSVHFQVAADGTRVLRVFSPLGVLLPPGLGLQIDDEKVGHAPFVRCQEVGCVAQVTLTKDLVGKFSAGKTAWFIVYQTQDAGIGIPVSLAGYNEAIGELSK